MKRRLKLKKCSLLYLTLALWSTAYVGAQNPGWALDSRSFQYSMNATGTYYANCTYGGQVGDSLAAFAGTELRGLAAVNEVINDKAMLYLTIYSNQSSGEELTFKWFAKDEKVVTDLGLKVGFSEGEILGTVAEPFEFWKERPLPIPIVAQNQDSLYVENQDANYQTYQWYYNDQVLENEVRPVLVPDKTGQYFVSVTSSTACVQSSAKSEVTVENRVLSIRKQTAEVLTVYPNPVHSQVVVDLSPFNGDSYQIGLHTLTGQAIDFRANAVENQRLQLTLGDIHPGTYVLTVSSATRRFSRILIKK